MWMIVTQHVTDAGGGLFEGFVRGQSGFKHRVEDAAVHRLQTVAHVRQRASDDDAHGVVDVAALHFSNQFGFRNNLIWK